MNWLVQGKCYKMSSQNYLVPATKHLQFRKIFSHKMLLDNLRYHFNICLTLISHLWFIYCLIHLKSYYVLLRSTLSTLNSSASNLSSDFSVNITFELEALLCA